MNEVREGNDVAAAIEAFASDIRAFLDDFDERHGHGHRRNPRLLLHAASHVYVRRGRKGRSVPDEVLHAAFRTLCPPEAR